MCVRERTMIFSEEFSEICTNLTDSERTELALRWGDDTETIILILDDVRENLLIRSILQVSTHVIKPLRRHIIPVIMRFE